jgi:PKD repeat protein
MADNTVMAAAPPGNIPPMAVITAPPAAAIGMEVIFDASTSTDVDGMIVSYDWDFGDTMVSTRRYLYDHTDCHG